MWLFKKKSESAWVQPHHILDKLITMDSRIYELKKRLNKVEEEYILPIENTNKLKRGAYIVCGNKEFEVILVEDKNPGDYLYSRAKALSSLLHIEVTVRCGPTLTRYIDGETHEQAMEV